MARPRDRRAPILPAAVTPSDSHIRVSTTSPAAQDTRSWRRIEPREYVLLAIPILVVSILAYPYLPPGICLGDSGDLQLASVALGVMHPPGYPGLATLGFLLSLVPGIDKPFLITLGCLGSGLLVLWLCTLFQLRLGVHAIAAATMTLLLAAHKRFWFNVIAPEVYMPALALLAAAAYLLLRYGRVGRTRDLVLSSLCLGICVGSRPSALLTVPFFVIAYWFAARGLEQLTRRRLWGLALAVVCTLLPVLYSFAYVWVRDTPTADYNYLEHYTRTNAGLPESTDGFQAKARRVVWLLSAEQFQHEFGTTWSGVRSKLRWLRHDLLYGQPVRLGIIVLLILAGTVTCFKRNRVAAWLLVGIGLHSVVFVLLYRIYGQAADLTPLVFAATVLLGVSLSPLVPLKLSRRRAIGSSVVAILAVVAVWRMANVPARWSIARDADALPFLEALDPATLPKDALVLSGWTHAVPLWYAQVVTMDRPDVEVLAGEPGQWSSLSKGAGDRPVFTIQKTSRFDGQRLEPYRNVWRVLPLSDAQDERMIEK